MPVMTLYRLTLRLTAPLGTPLAGPTLFGQLCWIKRERDGEAALNAWLADPVRIWRVSDGFAHGFLPKPLCHPRPLPAVQVKDHKERKKKSMVCRKAWLQHRKNWDEYKVDDGDFAKDEGKPRRIAHNTVDRYGRGTAEEGGLFFMEEDWRHSHRHSSRVDVYIESADTKQEVHKLVAELGATGFGRDASTGRGRWVVESAKEDQDLASGPGKRRMSLSRGILTPETMRDALWRLIPHFGRTGPQLSLAGVSAFKRPALLIRPGATFTPAGNGPFGAWKTGLHPERPEIGINGLHVAVPFDEAMSGEAHP